MDKQQDHVAVLRDMLTDYATGADGSGPTTISAEEAALTAAISALTVDRAHIEGLEAEKAAQFIRAREWAERCGQQEARAEAAEARVRELEGLLIRARNPHAAKCPAAYRDSDTCTYGLDAALSTTPEAAQK